MERSLIGSEKGNLKLYYISRTNYETQILLTKMHKYFYTEAQNQPQTLPP